MENTYNLVSNTTFPVMWFTRPEKHPFIYWKNKLLGACQVFKLWMKWPDGTSDDAKPQSHTEVCQLYTRAHTAGRAIAASDRQWGIFVDRVDKRTLYFYSHHRLKRFEDACFSHTQGAAGETIKPVKMSKLCQNCQNTSKSKRPKVGFIHRCLLVLLVVLGAPSLCHEAFGELLKVPGVFHLNLWLLSEEILKVLQQLDPHVCLLIQTFLLLHQLGPDLWRDTSAQTG